ncbi:hypothetical protein LguiA_029573 [Lonicera macranthoides]
MDSENDSQSHDMNNSGPREESISDIDHGRGPAVLVRLTKMNVDERREVFYNKLGQYIGSTRSDFASYTGLLARTMVPISYASWHKVPQSTKENLWTAMKEFGKLQAERQAMNKYPHHMSKLGYAGLVEKKKAEGEDIDEEDRAKKWLLGRMGKNGCMSDATKEVDNKIREVKSQVASGTIVTQGASDVLTLALGTAEHGGRVRGVGKGVTPTTYFNLVRRGSKQHVQDLESRLREADEREKDKDRQIQMLTAQLAKSQNGSLTSPLLEKVSSNTQKSNNKKFAKPSSDLSGSYNSPSKRKNVKVSSLKRKNEKVTPSKRKSEKLTTATWKNEKVNGNAQMQHQNPMSSPISNIGKVSKSQDGGDETTVMEFAIMVDVIMKTDAIRIPMNIFGDNLESTYVPKHELIRFCKMEELDIVCIYAYMSGLKALVVKGIELHGFRLIPARGAWLPLAKHDFDDAENRP